MSRFRPGSRRGERFDLIVANPPFAITPEARQVFHESEAELDSFCRRTVADVIDAVSAEAGAPRDEVRPELLRVLRRLVETGFLVP